MRGSEPRQGRNSLAQGDSPGTYGPHFLLFPLPRQAGKGAGGEGVTQDTRLKPWARLRRPDMAGLSCAPGFHLITTGVDGKKNHK